MPSGDYEVRIVENTNDIFKGDKMEKGSKECQEYQLKSVCWTCPNCDACITDVSMAFAKLVTKDLNIQ